MVRSAALLATLLLLLVLPAAASAQSLPELFHKVKSDVKAGAWQDALRTLDALETEAGKPGNENARQQLAAPVAFYRGVCEANLGNADRARDEFEAFLGEQPNASIDPAMYSKKAVEAFELARKAIGTPDPIGNGSPSLFRAYQEFKPPANISDLPDERWAQGPVRWLLTSKESHEWAQLTTGGEREIFVEKFWAARNPTPGSSDNIFRTSFERRAAFADAYFREDEEQRGSLTDRGMVFVLLGPPTWGGRKPLRTGDDVSDAEGLSRFGSHDAANAQAALSAGGGKVSSGTRAVVNDQFNGPGVSQLDAANNYREVWHYRRELLPKGVSYQQVDFEFITKQGYGSNVLQRDPQALNTLGAAKAPSR
jgi:GWxTD domain-containing protein